MEYFFVGIVLILALTVVALSSFARRNESSRRKWMDKRDSERLKEVRSQKSLQSIDDPFQLKVRSIRETHGEKGAETPRGKKGLNPETGWVATKSQDDLSPSRSRSRYRMN